MSTDRNFLQALVIQGARFSEVLSHLPRDESGVLRAIDFLRLFQEDLEISFVESRKLLEHFDPEMNPLIDIAEIDKLGDELLRTHFPERP